MTWTGWSAQQFIVWFSPRFASCVIGGMFLTLAWGIWDAKCRKRNKELPEGHRPHPEMQEAMRKDPQLRAMMEDLEKNGNAAAQKYKDDPEIMGKVRKIKAELAAKYQAMRRKEAEETEEEEEEPSAAREKKKKQK
mmetsp:Transcript_525/g.1318  ORF Transcript_525/g.1318 Transcript_525/m.1318 type:complete len:136 (-) Transcript_525:178-585(-)